MQLRTGSEARKKGEGTLTSAPCHRVSEEHGAGKPSHEAEPYGRVAADQRGYDVILLDLITVVGA